MFVVAGPPPEWLRRRYPRAARASSCGTSRSVHRAQPPAPAGRTTVVATALCSRLSVRMAAKRGIKRKAPHDGLSTMAALEAKGGAGSQSPRQYVHRVLA